MKRHLMVGVCLVAFVVAGVAVVEAGDWVKLGSSTLLPSKGGGTVKVKAADEVSKLMLKVSKEKVTVTGVKVTFADGTEKAVDVTMKLRPGIDSEAIEIGDSGALSLVEIMVSSDGKSASSRSPVKVYGA